MNKLFPLWNTDSRRVLAINGRSESFRQSMVECYRRMADYMPDNGFQIVMFTHQDAEVWSDLALIMWASGLQVTAAWTVQTETESAGIKQGNYVQGTVLLVLRKRKGNRSGDLSEIFPDLQTEVQHKIKEMQKLDDKDDPNFGDADYQLAAYAAAMRVLTAYSSIEEIDVERELYRPRQKGQKSPLTDLISRAVRLATDYLNPVGLDPTIWFRMSPEERLYLKGLEVEAHGEHREGVYQEMARGYGVGEYRSLLASGAANQVRLKSPSEFRSVGLKGEGFAGSLLRLVLFAVYVTARDGNPNAGRTYLRQETADYWEQRQTIVALLRYLHSKPTIAMPHWEKDLKTAELLRGLIENDGV